MVASRRQRWRGRSYGSLRIRTDRGGLATVEAALILPVFFICIFMIIDLGFEFFTQAALDIATQNAARQIQIDQINGSTSAPVVTYICARVAALVPKCSSSLQVYATSQSAFGSIVRATISGTTMTPTTFNVGNYGTPVLLQVAYEMPMPAPVINSSINYRMLLSSYAFLNEP